MDLKGAKIKNLYSLCSGITSDKEGDFSVNIPFYQRPFSWTEENIERLYLDYKKNVENIDKNKNKEYFIGSLLTVEKSDSYDIIDGQQRLTTLYLINFIKFIILRAYIAELFDVENYFGIERSLTLLLKSSKYLFEVNNKSEEIKNEIIEKIGTNEPEEIEKAKKIFMEEFSLEALSQSHEDEFFESQIKGIKKFFKDKKLKLKYSRETHNKKIKESISNCVIKLNSQNLPKLMIKKSDDEAIKSYTNAIEKIFNLFFSKQDSDKSVLIQIKKKIDALDDFLKNIQFCLIHTGDENDAYTLFEVLNDRAVALDDLDLVKNSFYKRYCELNKNEAPDEIDKTIEELEMIWGDQIFNKNIGANEKKIVFYLGTCFILGDTTINFNEKDKIAREKINLFLEEKQREYLSETIKEEFTVYKNVLEIIRFYGFTYQSTHLELFEAENGSHNIIRKTLLLLHQNKLYGVMGAIINSILFKYRKKEKLICLKEFLSNIENDTDILEISKNIWKLCLLSPTYQLPKEYSDKALKNNFLKRSLTTKKLEVPEITVCALDKAKKEFNYIKEIKKGQKDNMLKLLFLLLMKYEPNEYGKLEKKEGHFKYNDVKKLELDHFEPNKVNQKFKDYYFMPENELERDKYVQCMGNFILLDKTKNIEKGNAYSESAFKFYQESFGKNIWIIKEMKENFEKNSKSINNIKIPNQEFFDERKNQLFDYFKQAILLS